MLAVVDIPGDMPISKQCVIPLCVNVCVCVCVCVYGLECVTCVCAHTYVWYMYICTYCVCLFLYSHFLQTHHTYTMELGSQRVWDYAGGASLQWYL